MGEAPAGALGDKPWKIEARAHDGSSFVLLVADGDGDDVWARVEGADEMLKLAGYSAKNIRKTLADVRDKGILKLDAGAITRVDFVPEEGKPFSVASKAGEWRFEDGTLADPETALNALTTATASRFADAGQMEEAAAALAKPDFVARVATAAGPTSLTFGPVSTDEPNRNQRWARIEGPAAATADPFLMQDYMAKRFRKKRDELLWKKLYTFDKSEIATVAVAWPDGKTRVELTRDPASGALVPTDLPEGKQPKRAVLTTIESTLSSLRAKDFFADKKGGDVGLTDDEAYVATVTLGDGTSFKLWLSKDAKSGPDPYATTDGGPLAGRVFTVNQYQALNLEKEPAELVE